MTKKAILISLLAILSVSGFLVHVSGPDINRNQYNLNYTESAEMISSWHGQGDKFSVLDKQALHLFTSIKFCGGGDTTPDGWIRISTDQGDVIETGIIKPNLQTGQLLRVQNSDVGLGYGCSEKDQSNFETFYNLYIRDAN